MTRFNFPQTEVLNPLGILLAQHLSQLDEAQRNAAEGMVDDDAGDDPPRPEVAGAILATPPTLAGDLLGPQFADGGEQGGESSTTGDGTLLRNSRSTPFPNGIPIDSIRVDFTAGNLRFTTESTLDLAFLDEDLNGALEGQSATNTVAEDRAEVGTLIPPDRVPEGTIVTPIARSE